MSNAPEENNEILLIEKPNLFNIQAEQIVLGTIILNNNYLDNIIDFLTKEHFYEPAHKIIFEHIIHTMQRANIVADSITLKSFFDTDELLKTIGGSKYLSILLSMGVGIVDIVDYAKIIQDLALKRKLVFIGEEIVNDAYKKANKTTALTQIENANDKLFCLQENIGLRNNLEQVVYCFANEIHDQKCCLEDPKYRTKDLIRTGFKAFDSGDPAIWNSNFEGFFKGDLNILAGKTSMGKTTIAIQILINALNQNKTVALFSLEMSKKSIMQKIIANQSGINSRKIRSRKLTKEEFDKSLSIADEFSRKSLYISDKAGINCGYIDRNLKKITKKRKVVKNKNGTEKEVFQKVDLVIVDYLQKMKPTGKNFSRNDEIGSITGELKEIALKFNCCVLCLAQLNRKLDGRDDKIPRLDDLRDSGNIEQDADMVIFAYRKVYYQQLKLSKLNKEDEDYKKDLAELDGEIRKNINNCRLLIRKNRSGVQYGDVDLSFYPEYSEVKDRAKEITNSYAGFRK